MGCDDYRAWLDDPDWHVVMQAVKRGVESEDDLRAVMHADVLRQAWSTVRVPVGASLVGSVWNTLWLVYIRGGTP